MSERKDTFQKETLFDKKYRTNPAIVSMEMRQRMIIVVHVERYSIKNRDYWHTAGSSRVNTRVGGALTPPMCEPNGLLRQFAHRRGDAVRVNALVGE